MVDGFIKYYGEFLDYEGDKIEIKIYKDGYGGIQENLKLADNPLYISVPSKDLFEPIFGMGLKLHIINTSGNLQYYDELFSGGETEYYITVEKGSLMLFEGFIIPEMYSQTMEDITNITISASNQLQYLKDKVLVENTGSTFLSQMDVIKEIIWSTKILRPIYVKNSIFSSGYTTSYDIDDNVFDNVYFDKNLYNDNGDVTDSYIILEDILKLYNCRLFYFDKKWIIERLPEILTNDEYKIYIDSGTTSSGVTSTEYININNNYILNNSGNLSMDNGYRFYELNLNTDYSKNLINSYFHNTDLGLNQDVFMAAFIPVYILPYPERFEWKYGYFITNPQIKVINSGFYNDAIVNGIHFINKSPFNNNSVSTKFSIMYDESTSITIKATLSLEDLVGLPADNNIDFSIGLRYFKSGATYNNKWIYVDEDDEVQVTSTPTFFTHNVSGNTYGTYDETSKFVNITLKIPIGSKLPFIRNDLVGSNPLNIINFYLDIYTAFGKYGGLIGNKYIETKVGNVSVLTTDYPFNNLISSSIDNKKNRKLKLNLNQFCTRNVTILNSLYFKDDNFYKLCDKFYLNDKPDFNNRLQLLYLSNIIQQYSQQRYKISGDFYITTNDYIKMNNIFTYNHLKDSGDTALNFIPLGYEMNVKEKSYRLELVNYIPDDGYYLIDEYNIGEDEELTLTPNFFEFEAIGGSGYIEVTSNTYWYISSEIPSTMYFDKTEGEYNDVVFFTIAQNFEPSGPSIENRIHIIDFSTSTLTRGVEIQQAGYGIS